MLVCVECVSNPNHLPWKCNSLLRQPIHTPVKASSLVQQQITTPVKASSLLQQPIRTPVKARSLVQQPIPTHVKASSLVQRQIYTPVIPCRCNVIRIFVKNYHLAIDKNYKTAITCSEIPLAQCTSTSNFPTFNTVNQKPFL